MELRLTVREREAIPCKDVRNTGQKIVWALSMKRERPYPLNDCLQLQSSRVAAQQSNGDVGEPNDLTFMLKAKMGKVTDKEVRDDGARSATW